MEAPGPRYILTRAAFFIALLVVFLMAFGFVKKEQRRRAIYTELESIASDSSFFKQFYAADARRTLARAVGLIAEATTLGVDSGTSIDRALGIKPRFFKNEAEHIEPGARERIIRSTLRGNYENLLKLGYTPDFRTLDALKNGDLPPIPAGPQRGRKPVIATLIPPAISPGMDKVLANLEIRPPDTTDGKPTDIEIAAAKQLARDLADANVIEGPVRDRILAGLSASAP